MSLIDDVKMVLAADLPIDAEVLRQAVEECMKLTEPILTARVDAQKTLVNKRQQYRRPKDKEYTDFDRGIMLEGDVSEFMADYETMSGLEKLLSQRLEALLLLLQTAQGNNS